MAAEAKWFFQFVFCAVSLAIVWGTTLERIKFGVYVIYAIIFSTLIYPIGAHWVFGGGWLQSNIGMQDFAGSTAVHLIGATGGLAVLLLLGARKGKYGGDGKPRPIPGHSMPLFGLGVLILWLGWFGFNAGTAFGVTDGRFAEVILVTQLACAAGVLTALLTSRFKQKTIDIGMVGNGAIAALVAITAPSGYVEAWAAPIIGAVAGVLVVYGDPRYRQGPRRPGWCAFRARLGRYLGHPVVRDLLGAAAVRVQRIRVTNSEGDFLGGFLYASGLIGKGANEVPGAAFNLEAFEQLGCPGTRRRCRVHVRVRDVVRDVLRDQEGVRPPSHGERGGRRSRYFRARHVRLSGAVHPPG